MADEKPIHVRVAEALGWPEPEFIAHEGNDPNRPIYGWRKCYRDHGEYEDCKHLWHCGLEDYYKAPDYDTEWSETGLLIERLKISVRLSRMPFDPAKPWTAWIGASDVGGGEAVSHGATPLLAVCALILALFVAGKLPKEG